jgi:hypothetical protein
MDFTTLPLFGAPLTHYETYFEFEGPRTFALRSLDWSIYYLVNAVDESDDGNTLTFLLVMVPEHRFRAIRSGQVTFREAFSEAGDGTVSSVDWSYTEAGWVSSIVPYSSSDNLPLRWLPAPTARLSLKTPTVARFERSELRQVSDAQNRTLFAIEVEGHGRNITEFPTRKSGELQVAIQMQLDALATEVHNGAHSAARDVQTTVLDLRAASFVLVLAIDKHDTLIERTELTSDVLDRLRLLIIAASTENERGLYDELAGHSTRVRNRFRDLLAPLVETGSGMTLNTALVGFADVVRTPISASAVLFAHQAIVNVKPTIRHIDISRATLEGLNIRLNRFDIFDNASAVTYTGYMSPEAAEQADGMKVSESSFASARLRMEWEFEEEAQSGVRYVLESITAIE